MIFLIYSSGGHFVQKQGTICAILSESIMRNISVKLFEFGPVIQMFVYFLFALIFYIPGQQFFSHVGTGLSGLNQYLATDKVSCSRTHHSDSAGGEILTSNPNLLPTEPLRSRDGSTRSGGGDF